MGSGSIFTSRNNSNSFSLGDTKYNEAYCQWNQMNNINKKYQMGNMNQMGQGIPMTIRQKILEN